MALIFISIPRLKLFYLIRAVTFQIFSNALEYCIHNKVVARQGDTYVIGEDHKLQFLLNWSISPALTTILICMDIMSEVIFESYRLTLC